MPCGICGSRGFKRGQHQAWGQARYSLMVPGELG